MTETGLPVSSATGNQDSTDSPQASAQTGSSLAGQKASGVQPGTSSDLLTTSNGGVPLQSTSLTTVGLGASSTGQSQQTTVATHRHIHPALFGFSAVLLIVAVVLFWSASRSEKNTTI